MYNIIICEDYKIERDELKENLTKIFNNLDEKISIQEYSSGEELLDDLNNVKKSDIIFLDIIMKKISGIDVAIFLREKNIMTKIIFLTAMPNFLNESYFIEYNTYLLKPINYEFLNEIISKLVKENFANKNDYIVVWCKNQNLTIP
ncbi:MAG: response regulator, partial [Clostridioides sp.]|nr:response regulator [Clostridioides sp.]